MTQLTLFKIRDCRKKDQFKIDDKYLNGYAKYFGSATSVVYMSLCWHAEFNTQECFPSEEFIAKEHCITERSVRLAIKRLKSANIIQVERERTSKGKWLNNVYILMDKSVWKDPEEIRDLWTTRGKKQHNPEEIKDISRGNQRPIKDTNSKDINNKELATLSVAGKELNNLIELFKPINPTYQRLFANKTQRQALERLVKQFGPEKVKKMIEYLPKIFGKPYAPRISTPYQLEQKLADLIAYLKSKAEEKINFVDLTKLPKL